MKITKKVAASAEVQQPSVTDAAGPALNDMVLSDAKSYINQAINSLGAYARRTGDAKAKEAIANLGVILLDLQ